MDCACNAFFSCFPVAWAQVTLVVLHMRLRLALTILTLVCLPVGASPAPDRSEHILDFHSDITLESDGTFLVRETITVNATGSRIRHGIYRDFPTRYKDHFGNTYVVGFQLLSAERDGFAEAARVQDQINGKRIYLGDPKSFVSS